MLDLIHSDYFALFLIIALGILLGKIKLWGISLDSSAVIFVALVFGHFGVKLDPNLQKIGLVLFIFTIGIQVGPGFLKTFRTSGGKLVLISGLLVFSGALTTLLLTSLFGIDKNLGIGLFTGAMTSTPGLAAAIEVTNSPHSSIGYGIAYPFGVIGVILFVNIMPKILNLDISKAANEIESKKKEDHPEMFSKHFIVENDKLFNKSLRDLNIRAMTGATVSRILQEGTAFSPKPKSILKKGDLVKAVGTKEALDKLKLLVGRETDQSIPFNRNYDIQSILVSNSIVVNKTIKQLNMMENFNATVTRIRRSGIDITPSSTSVLKYGDKVIVTCDKENMKGVIRLLGNSEKKLSNTNFFPIAAGIVLGVLVGKISIVFPTGFTFSPGVTGGVLITSILLSSIGKTGPIIWSMSGNANRLIRQIGLLLFLAVVGTEAGENLASTFEQYGISLFLMGMLITLLPMLLAAFLGHYVFKINILPLLGAITGGMTSTPGLSAVTSLTDDNSPSTAYATVYPLTMVVLIIFIQVLSIVQG